MLDDERDLLTALAEEGITVRRYGHCDDPAPIRQFMSEPELGTRHILVTGATGHQYSEWPGSFAMVLGIEQEHLHAAAILEHDYFFLGVDQTGKQGQQQYQVSEKFHGHRSVGAVHIIKLQQVYQQKTLAEHKYDRTSLPFRRVSGAQVSCFCRVTLVLLNAGVRLRGSLVCGTRTLASGKYVIRFP